MNKGIQWAILAAVLFGGSTPIAKLLVRDFDPVSLASILYLGSGIGLLLIRIVLRSGHSEAPIGRAEWPWLMGAVLFGGILGPLLLLTGLQKSDASTASLLLNLEGVFTALLAWFAFRENVDRRIAAGMGAIVIGSVILSWPTGGSVAFSWGSLAIAAACLSWGIDNNLTQKVSACDPLQVASIKGLVAGGTNLGFSLMLGKAMPPLSHIFAAGIIGFLGYGLSLVFFVQSLRHIGTARTGAYFSLAPFFGMGLSLFLFGEEVTLKLFLGGLCMGVGVWLHISEKHCHGHSHAGIIHDHLHLHDEHHLHDHEHDADVDPRTEHSHEHNHSDLLHEHPHFPDIHHRHDHSHENNIG